MVPNITMKYKLIKIQLIGQRLRLSFFAIIWFFSLVLTSLVGWLTDLSLEYFATNESMRYETHIYLLNSNKHLISAFSHCMSLYIVHVLATGMSRTLVNKGQNHFLPLIEIAYLEVSQSCLSKPPILLL